MVGSTPKIDQAIVDLLETKDSGLIGDIGEMLAWKYLRREKGVSVYSFSTGIPYTRDFHAGLLEYLRKQQASYLKNLWFSGPRRYDFIGIKYVPSPDAFNMRTEFYLIEVKTRRLNYDRHDLGGRMKGKISENILKEKRLGFKPLLVTVDLLPSPSWRVRITCKEL